MFDLRFAHHWKNTKRTCTGTDAHGQTHKPTRIVNTFWKVIRPLAAFFSTFYKKVNG